MELGPCEYDYGDVPQEEVEKIVSKVYASGMRFNSAFDLACHITQRHQWPVTVDQCRKAMGDETKQEDLLRFVKAIIAKHPEISTLQIRATMRAKFGFSPKDQTFLRHLRKRRGHKISWSYLKKPERAAIIQQVMDEGGDYKDAAKALRAAGEQCLGLNEVLALWIKIEEWRNSG